MPLVRDATLPLNLTFTLSDNNGNRGFVSFNLPNDLTVAEAETYVADLEAGLAAVSDARIERAQVTVVFTQPDTYVYEAPDTAEVERKLVLVFNDATGFYDFRAEVPSPKFTLETDGTDDIDIADPNVQLLAASVIGGPLGPGNGAITFAGRDIVRIEKAYVSHRTRRRKR